MVKTILIVIAVVFGTISSTVLLGTIFRDIAEVAPPVMVVTLVVLNCFYWLNAVLDRKESLTTWIILGMLLVGCVAFGLNLSSLLREFFYREISGRLPEPVRALYLFLMLGSMLTLVYYFRSEAVAPEEVADLVFAVGVGVFWLGALIAAMRVTQVLTGHVIPPLDSIPFIRLVMFWGMAFWGVATGLLDLWLVKRVKQNRPTSGAEKYVVFVAYILILTGVYYLKTTFADYYAVTGVLDLGRQILLMFCFALASISISVFLNNRNQHRQIAILSASSLLILFVITLTVPLELYWGAVLPVVGSLSTQSNPAQIVIASSVISLAMIMVYDWSSRRKQSYAQTVLTVEKGALIMGDQYNVGQAGAVGPKAHAHDMTFTQMWGQASSSIDLPILASELSRLRSKLKEQATAPEHDVVVGEVALAEAAATKGEGPVVMEHLAKAGKWALEVATKIGVAVATEALRKSLGI
jgi:hypothetical protein